MDLSFAGTFQGRFVSDGTSKFIALPAGVSYMRVYNQTKQYAVGADTGVEYYWQLGMTQGRGTIYPKTLATEALSVAQVAANAGFFLQDTSLVIPGASVALTGITNAMPPVVNTGNTSGLIAGDVVRIFNTVGAQQLGGIDFTIGTIVANTSFTLAYMDNIVSANPGAGTFRKIPFDPIFYPRRRVISKIISHTTNSDLAIVTMTVTHGYTIGQKVRFIVPTVTALAFGMTELNGVQATIVNIGEADADGITNTITINVDVSGFTAFAWPLTAGPKFTPAQVVPIGEDTAQALSNSFFPALSGQNILGDSTVNTAEFGMLLMAGANSPAGEANDVIYWVAGRSWNV